MSSETTTQTSFPIGYRFDVAALVLIGLIVLFQVGGIALAQLLQSSGAESAGVSQPTQSSNAGMGIGVVGLLIIETLVVVGAWRLYKRLSVVGKRIMRYIGMVLIAAYLAVSGLVVAVVAVLAYMLANKLLSRYNLDWITFDLAAVVLGIAIIGVLSRYVAPVVVIPVLVLTVVWDYLAVDLSDIMEDAMQASASVRIPNYLIIPGQLRVDRERVDEYIASGGDGESPDSVGLVIGLGDFALPGLLTASAAIAVGAWSAPAVGALVGCCVGAVALRHALEEREGGTPGLPWFNTGALAGFAIGAVLYSGSLATVVGL